MPQGFYQKIAQPRLPHPPITMPVLLIVEKAICAAWGLIRTNPRKGFDISTAVEDQITHELYEVLFDRVFNSGLVDGFNKKLFSVGHREPKLKNYNSKALDKMPDLVIRLVGRPAGVKNTQDGLFIECKPVDETHSLGTHYCKKGLARFVRGDYAWAMTTAMMVAYTRNGYSIRPKLLEALRKPSHKVFSIGTLRCCGRSLPNGKYEAVHSSKHRRKFTYRETGRVARPITIRHLWLKRD